MNSKVIALDIFLLSLLKNINFQKNVQQVLIVEIFTEVLFHVTVYLNQYFIHCLKVMNIKLLSSITWILLFNFKCSLLNLHSCCQK